MCGRYTQTSQLSELIETYEIDEVLLEEMVGTSFNVAPSQVAPVVYFRQKRVLHPLHWGIQPAWARPGARRLINARSETVREKASFRGLVETHRCLVPAAGFYEFQSNPGGRKTPHYFTAANGEPISFAGLWEESGEVGCFTILTTGANEEVSRLHDRMPVILEKADGTDWLNPTLSPGRFSELIRPRPNGYFAVHPVSTRVNSPAHNGPELILPEPRQEFLF